MKTDIVIARLWPRGRADSRTGPDAPPVAAHNSRERGRRITMEATTTTTRITARTRLGLGWSNTPAREGYCSINADTEPSDFGTLRQLREVLDRLARSNSGGTCWVWSYYIRRDGQWERLGLDRSRDINEELFVADNAPGERGQWSYEV